jgi:hypothetical protein
MFVHCKKIAGRIVMDIFAYSSNKSSLFITYTTHFRIFMNLKILSFSRELITLLSSTVKIYKY